VYPGFCSVSFWSFWSNEIGSELDSELGLFLSIGLKRRFFFFFSSVSTGSTGLITTGLITTGSTGLITTGLGLGLGSSSLIVFFTIETFSTFFSISVIMTAGVSII
jgi:hypothetical protein